MDFQLIDCCKPLCQLKICSICLIKNNWLLKTKSAVSGDPSLVTVDGNQFTWRPVSWVAQAFDWICGAGISAPVNMMDVRSVHDAMCAWLLCVDTHCTLDTVQITLWVVVI